MSLEEALKMPWAWKTTDLVRKTHSRSAAKACNCNLLWTETNSLHLFCLYLLVISDENSVSITLESWLLQIHSGCGPSLLVSLEEIYFSIHVCLLMSQVLFLNGYTIDSDVADMGQKSGCGTEVCNYQIHHHASHLWRLWLIHLLNNIFGVGANTNNVPEVHAGYHQGTGP